MKIPSDTEDIDLLPENFFSDREIVDVIDESINGKCLIYAKMSDDVIVPLFRVMNRKNQEVEPITV